MSETKHLIWATMMKNIVSILSFTALAYIFNHWWIALFALGFQSSVSYSNTHKTDDKDTDEDVDEVAEDF